MNQKSSYAFRIVLGGWLVYLGGSLLYQMFKEKPSNMIVMCMIAAAFMIIGGIFAGASLKGLYDIRKGELPAVPEDAGNTDVSEFMNEENKINQLENNKGNTESDVEIEEEETQESGQELENDYEEK